MTAIFIITLAGFLLAILCLIAIDMWGIETKKKATYAAASVLIIISLMLAALVLAAKLTILATQPIVYIA